MIDRAPAYSITGLSRPQANCSLYLYALSLPSLQNNCQGKVGLFATDQ